MGGSGGYDCFYQCMAYASSGAHDASYYEQQYQQFCGNSYYDPDHPDTYYSAEYASGHSGLIPVASGGVSLGNEVGFANQFYNASSITVGSGNTQSGADSFNAILSGSGCHMFLNLVQEGGSGHSAVIKGVSLDSGGNFIYQCWDSTLKNGSGDMVTYYPNGNGLESDGTILNGAGVPSGILILQNQ